MARPIAPDDEPRTGAAPRRNATVAVVGAGDYIGSAIARRFAREGYTVFAGRRHGDKLAPLVADTRPKAGSASAARSTRVRKRRLPVSSTRPMLRAGWRRYWCRPW